MEYMTTMKLGGWKQSMLESFGHMSNMIFLTGLPKKKIQIWLNEAFGIKIQSSVYNELEKYCEETGLSKTVAVERILNKAFKEYGEKK